MVPLPLLTAAAVSTADCCDVPGFVVGFAFCFPNVRTYVCACSSSSSSSTSFLPRRALLTKEGMTAPQRPETGDTSLAMLYYSLRTMRGRFEKWNSLFCYFYAPQHPAWRRTHPRRSERTPLWSFHFISTDVDYHTDVVLLVSCSPKISW